MLAAGEEVESGTAVAVWAAALGDGAVRTFHARSEAEPGEESAAVTLAGVPELRGASGAIVLPDPYTFHTGALLRALRDSEPDTPVIGGQASARTFGGGAALFRDELVLEDGAVGLVFEGVPLAPFVSQGAAPLGPELTVTHADRGLIHELAGKPALAKLREVFDELDEHDRQLIGNGLLLGLVIDAGKPEYTQGDFLVRAVIGADADDGSITIGEQVQTGQIVQLHARDAHSADLDLERWLERGCADLAAPAGALCFTCNGRGQAMFGAPGHDAEMLARVLDDAATAGFFAAGEIGPAAGACFQHSFSASVALFGR